MAKMAAILGTRGYKGSQIQDFNKLLVCSSLSVENKTNLSPALRHALAAIIVLLGTIFSGASSAAAQVPTLTIGVLAWRGGDKARIQWEPTRDALQSAFPKYTIVLHPLSLKGMDAALAAKELDFFITNPGNYIEMEQRYGASRLVTLESVRVGAPAASVGTVIFTRSDRPDIQELDDLRGKTLMAVSREAFGGFQIGWRVLRQAKINPFTDLAGIKFAGFPLDNIVMQVAEGHADVGIVRAGFASSIHSILQDSPVPFPARFTPTGLLPRPAGQIMIWPNVLPLPC